MLSNLIENLVRCVQTDYVHQLLLSSGALRDQVKKNLQWRFEEMKIIYLIFFPNVRSWEDEEEVKKGLFPTLNDSTEFSLGVRRSLMTVTYLRLSKKRYHNYQVENNVADMSTPFFKVFRGNEFRRGKVE